MAAKLVSAVITRVRNLIDIDATTFTDDEILPLMQTAIDQLYGVIGEIDPERITTSTTISPDGSESYALPSDFLSIVGLEDANDVTILPYQWTERNDQSNAHLAHLDSTIRYRLLGTDIRLIPTQSTGTLTMWYVAGPGTLATDTSVEFFNNFENYVVFWVCGILSVKEEAGIANTWLSLASNELERIKKECSHRMLDTSTHGTNEWYSKH